MTFRFRSLFALARLNLGPKAALSAALLIAVNAALLVGAGYWSLTRDFDVRAERDIDLSLRTLTLAFAEAYPDAKITMRDGVVDRVEIPKMPEFTDHRIVDRATSYVGASSRGHLPAEEPPPPVGRVRSDPTSKGRRARAQRS